jgi:hypothetical protein
MKSFTNVLEQIREEWSKSKMPYLSFAFFIPAAARLSM